MALQKYSDKFWYFRTEADEDDDDDVNTSVMIPVDSITGIVTTSISQLTIYFRQARNAVNAEVTTGQHGYVQLTVTRGKTRQVMHSLVSAINAGPHHDGVTVIADDATTDFDGTTRAGKYLVGDITAVATISNK